jgi:GTPase SAR1 family protein
MYREDFLKTPRPPHLKGVYAVIGASSVGKTTLVRSLAESDDLYIGVDIDAELTRQFGEKGEGVVDFFQRIGFKKFQDHCLDAMMNIELEHRVNPKSKGKILLFDVGAGATYGSMQKEFSDMFNCMLLTSNPEYLWENREKARANHDSFQHFLIWQFHLQTLLHEKCVLRIDVAYLKLADVRVMAHKKLQNHADFTAINKTLK